MSHINMVQSDKATFKVFVQSHSQSSLLAITSPHSLINFIYFILNFSFLIPFYLEPFAKKKKKKKHNAFPTQAI